MAVAFRSASALSAVAVDECDFASNMPAGIAVGDILVAVFNTDQLLATTATGWESKVDENGTAEKMSLLWRRSDGADPTVFSLSEGVGVMLAFSGCVASGDPFGSVGTDASTSASATVTANTTTPPEDGCGVGFVAIAQDAVAIRTCSGYSGTAPTFTEAFDGGANDVTLGFNLSIAVAFGVQATAAATGSRTATLSGVPAENQGVMFSLKPAAGAGPAAAGDSFFFFQGDSDSSNK